MSEQEKRRLIIGGAIIAIIVTLFFLLRRPASVGASPDIVRQEGGGISLPGIDFPGAAPIILNGGDSRLEYVPGAYSGSDIYLSAPESRLNDRGLRPINVSSLPPISAPGAYPAPDVAAAGGGGCCGDSKSGPSPFAGLLKATTNAVQTATGYLPFATGR